MFLDYLRQHTPEREQKVMAAKAGISETTFSRWMSGKLVPNPTLSTIEKLARAYRTSVAELISDEPRPPIPLSPKQRAAMAAGDAVLEIAARIEREAEEEERR